LVSLSVSNYSIQESQSNVKLKMGFEEKIFGWILIAFID